MPSPAAAACPESISLTQRIRAWVAPTIAVGAFLCSALTYDAPGITIDEPTYADAAFLMRRWFGDLAAARSRADLAGVLSRDAIRRRWICHGVHGLNFHPPGLQYLHNAMRLATLGQIQEPWPGRLGGAVLLGLCAWALVRLVGKRHGLAAGAAAGVAFVAMPRVFGHSHLAATDFPLLAGWLLTTFAWMRAAASRRWSAALVPILGLTLLIKFTALAVFVPLWAWVLVYRRDRWRRFLVLSVLAGLFTIALDVPLWHNLPGELAEYVRQSLGRRHLAAVSCYYQGRSYHFSLPWHNGFVLTAITVPAATLALALVGVVTVAARRFRDRFGTLCVMNCALFLAVRALPTPGHDGVRLFLPMFAFVAGLAGIGLAQLGRWVGRLVRGCTARLVGRWAVVLALAGYGLVQVGSVHPFQLSYYNELVGGLSGAVARGYQATYWYDALTRDWYGQLGAVLPEGARVMLVPQFASLPRFAQDIGWLRDDISAVDEPPADFVLVLFRQDNMNETASRLHRGEIGERLLVQAHDGVPLLTLYRYHLERLPAEPSGASSRARH